MVLTGDGHGDVLADDKLFSISSGKSTDPVLMLRVALRSFRFADGLDGAEREKTKKKVRLCIQSIQNKCSFTM